MSDFSGSYLPEDVIFLLTPMDLAPTPVEDKERLIQSGALHYSEILAPEGPPSPEYLQRFEAAFARNRLRMAEDVARLALALHAAEGPPKVLVSLARAGTPVGALLARASRHLGRPMPHYSISIIRDRGIDVAALDTLRARHPEAELVFVDGWTGKGAIGKEMSAAARTYFELRGVRLDPGLVVLSDLAGIAKLAASGDDYLIPSAILNAVVSGLVSRSILNDAVRAAGAYHGCVYYRHLEPHDRSRAFLDAVDAELPGALDRVAPARWTDTDRSARKEACESFMQDALTRYGLNDRNRVKPGIGEATRAVLRRVPERVLVADRAAEDVAHLVHLAESKGAVVEERPELPYRAATLIRKLGARHAAWRSDAPAE